MAIVYVIGSTAVKNLGYSLRYPKDLDLVADDEGLQAIKDNFRYSEIKETSTPGYYKIHEEHSGEIDNMNTESNKLLFDMKPEFVYNMKGVEIRVPRISTLAAIKQSHLRSDVNCFKSFHDWKFYSMVLKAHPYTEEDLHFLKVRTKETNERLAQTQKRINLNVKNDAFFAKSQAMRKIEHDEVHRIVAFNDIPVFEMVKRDLSKAKIDKDLFDTLPEKTKRQMVLEESFVIGYERFSQNVSNPHRVYERGLAYFATTLCKGWFQDYIFDNIDYFLEYKPEFDFVRKVNNYIEENT